MDLRRSTLLMYLSIFLFKELNKKPEVCIVFIMRSAAKQRILSTSMVNPLYVRVRLAANVNLFFHAIFTQRDVHNVDWNSLHLGGN